MNNAFPTLILGAGPAAIQLAADIKAAANARIGLYNRPSEKGRRLKQHLAHTPSLWLTGAGKAQRTQDDAQVTIDRYCDDLALVGGDWHRLILAVPADQYHDVLRQVPWAALPQLRSLILLSPSIGSGLMAQSLLQDAGQSHVEVISLSSYYADTKYQNAEQPYRAYTKAFKQRIYLAGAGARSDCAELDWLCSLLARHGIDAQRGDSLLAAERFSITNYVHPPLALAETTLQAIFQPQAPIQYLYKTHPEGPICPEAIADMLALSQDYQQLLNRLGIEAINLLRFLNDDNYPVPPRMVSRRWIDQFPQLAPTEQCYALFTRYTALLVDPYSEPDAQGRYYDFSAVRVARVFQDAQGRWRLPRVPQEDVCKLRVLVLLAQRLDVEMPAAQRLLARFQQALQRFVTRIGAEHCHPSLLDDTCDEQADIIYRQWRRQA
ncbi:opine metallophore biosynthesis dehydrogenase [Serratia marcescens]|uniref:opine metallophore biosynthesis dehydrogenase n=1 Tax=Serratia marcescens TaxID=615 RepID=UPI001BD6247D|nr:opine metallophore biosynthesis dehydrogenase [Serratia marcescens]MDV5743336.1 opine metallophore biosynthesis dehydrogenase [Serratia marcescens]MDV5748249.1 opine metallophore biosynthesis dehydrogenase [Serratia marcescens]MDV5779685.1 opine metallophore biosynthesis dehydrogenase [Serratia marcescens]MDV5784626.1 opine metallophore biosynthesis dehydrogenase [Serratia marcescens]MDV5831524.1 opine metallophore biosynthesis dehydrogenase [Serratia marcescens]